MQNNCAWPDDRENSISRLLVSDDLFAEVIDTPVDDVVDDDDDDFFSDFEIDEGE